VRRWAGPGRDWAGEASAPIPITLPRIPVAVGGPVDLRPPPRSKQPPTPSLEEAGRAQAQRGEHRAVGSLGDLMLGAYVSARRRSALFEYIDDFYDRWRRHSSFGYPTPPGLEQ
jgi:hypothetical protein